MKAWLLTALLIAASVFIVASYASAEMPIVGFYQTKSKIAVDLRNDHGLMYAEFSPDALLIPKVSRCLKDVSGRSFQTATL